MWTGGYRPTVRAEQRVAAHGLLVASGGAFALVRVAGGPVGDCWELPGGTVRHGEHPRETVLRAATQVLGVQVAVTGVRAAVADVVDLPQRDVTLHTVRLVYDLAAEPGWAGRLSPHAGAVAVGALGGLDLAGFTARVLGLPVPVPTPPAHPIRPVRVRPQGDGAGGSPPRVQRVGAYALLPDAGRLLLTRYTGSGRWSLPGGGIDHGEQPEQALLREVHEETGLTLADARLVDVDSVHFTGHAPDGTLEDFHAVRIVYRGSVPGDAEPAVVEVDGSSDAAAWIPLADLDRYPVTRFVGVALRLLR
jgi:8-oxo-dGTP diphosphatase